MMGPEGTFATDLRKGLVIAVQAGGSKVLWVPDNLTT
jgi:hypothetical protein